MTGWSKVWMCGCVKTCVDGSRPDVWMDHWIKTWKVWMEEDQDWIKIFLFFEINVNGILASLIGLVMIDRINKH